MNGDIKATSPIMLLLPPYGALAVIGVRKRMLTSKLASSIITAPILLLCLSYWHRRRRDAPQVHGPINR